MSEVETGAPSVAAASTEMHLGLLRDQLNAAAQKVNLLAEMALTRTEGYQEAFAIYSARLADYNELITSLGG